MGKIKRFDFKGELASSKSLMNRALVVQSFFPNLKIQGHTRADDVENLKKCLSDLNQETFHCGEGGTTFRFLLARLSREKGEFFIQGSKRLLERPHSELYEGLRALGTDVKPTPEGVRLSSRGWRVPDSISMSLETSSQFLSAILLSSWKLSSNLKIKFEQGVGSESYLQMTLDLLRQLGMEIIQQQGSLFVPQGQSIDIEDFSVEPDMSSAFAVAALAVAGGQAHLLNFPTASLQPDFRFIEILRGCGAAIDFDDTTLKIQSSQLRGGTFDLRNNPDLFPVLSVLLGRAQGESLVTGLESLTLKESNRIEKSLELLRKLGVKAHWDGRCFRIVGTCQFTEEAVFSFDPEQDHRMAMAAAVAQVFGAPIEILTPEVVNKSFPGFWEIVS